MVFVKKQEKSKPGFNIAVLMSKNDTPGDIGIEIEVEGTNIPGGSATPPPWARKEDHSLRGPENGEFVLAKPISFSEVEGALDALWKAFAEKKTQLDESNRTSVHVHLNAQRFHLNRLTSFMAMYYCLEEVLTNWCGEHRVGNLFCLRAKDATAIVQYAREFIRTEGRAGLTDGMHYSGLNISSLKKFGSLEIRTLRGTSDKRVILDWINILRRLYDLSAEYPDPRTLCDSFSAEGPLAFFENILGPQTQTVRSVVSMTDEQIRNSMYEGIRLAQDLCYCRDWSDYSPMTIAPDPFGRKASVIAIKLTEATSPMPFWTPSETAVDELEEMEEIMNWPEIEED